MSLAKRSETIVLSESEDDDRLEEDNNPVLKSINSVERGSSSDDECQKYPLENFCRTKPECFKEIDRIHDVLQNLPFIRMLTALGVDGKESSRSSQDEEDQFVFEDDGVDDAELEVIFAARREERLKAERNKDVKKEKDVKKPITRRSFARFIDILLREFPDMKDVSEVFGIKGAARQKLVNKLHEYDVCNFDHGDMRTELSFLFNRFKSIFNSSQKFFLIDGMDFDLTFKEKCSILIHGYRETSMLERKTGSPLRLPIETLVDSTVTFLQKNRTGWKPNKAMRKAIRDVKEKRKAAASTS